MRVEKQNDGQWCVIGESGEILLQNVSNAKAWRYVDLNTGEQISRGEQTTDWSIKMKENGQ